MAKIRAVIQLFGMMFLIGVTFWFGRECGKLALSYPEPFKIQPELLVIELTIELQERVGARPDGIVGPEFKRLVNAQCDIDKPEYFNRCAVAVMERMARKEAGNG